MTTSPPSGTTASRSARTRRRAWASGACLATAAVVCAVSLGASPAASARPADTAPLSTDTAEAASGKPPAGFSSWRELTAAQEPLSRAANAIEEKLGGSEAFAGIAVSVETGSVTLYHKGDAGRVEAAVAPERAKGVRVDLRSAPYSRDELRTAAREVVGKPLTIDGRPTTVHAAGPRHDGSGILVQGAPRATSAQNTAAGRARSTERAVEPAVPWSGSVTPAPTPLESREQDVPLHSGGSLLRRTYKGGPVCSAGFSVWLPQANTDYLMTAAHCGEIGKQWYAGDTDVRAGTMEKRWEKHDTALIATHHGGQHNFTVWAGQPIYRQTQQLRQVKDARHSVVGEYLCASGSLSGEICGLKVVEPKQFERIESNRDLAEVYLLKQTEKRPTAMKGDSGGPIFSYNVDGSVVARGLISAGQGTPATCSNPAVNNSPVNCYRNIYMTDVVDVLNINPGMRIHD
ncbi:hypothetical protein [Streptomyces sp. NPDC052496]|uniref:hypothetical protein n=1 Tax=Streptomyces sp. NPDC052496 TaxID=3154951 RepID=UPI00343054C1